MTGAVITGRGMVSSLGEDVVAACAAARAGLVSREDLDYEVRAPDGSTEGACGHTVRDLTKGFEGFGRLVRLVQAGLVDLRTQIPDGPWRNHDTGFYLSVPDPLREHTGLERLLDPEERPQREEDAAEAREQMEEEEDDGVARLLSAGAAAADWEVEPTLRFSVASGHSGVAQALARAVADLARGTVSAAVVGGVDSLLDDATLDWLAGLGRLKTRVDSVGLQPGEAAAFLLVEPPDVAAMRRRQPAAVIRQVELASEPQPFFSGKHALGVGFAEAVARITPAAPLFCISDHNGEVHRALDWGLASVRLRSRAPAFAPAALWYTAASFGDTGAASGAVSLCMATSAFLRGYAPSPAALVTSADDGPTRAAVLVARA